MYDAVFIWFATREVFLRWAFKDYMAGAGLFHGKVWKDCLWKLSILCMWHIQSLEKFDWLKVNKLCIQSRQHHPIACVTHKSFRQNGIVVSQRLRNNMFLRGERTVIVQAIDAALICGDLFLKQIAILFAAFYSQHNIKED